MEHNDPETSSTLRAIIRTEADIQIIRFSLRILLHECRVIETQRDVFVFDINSMTHPDAWFDEILSDLTEQIGNYLYYQHTNERNNDHTSSL